MARTSVTPVAAFTGFPDGVKVQFRPGHPVSVPAPYAALLRSKGLVESLPRKPAKPRKSKPRKKVSA